MKLTFPENDPATVGLNTTVTSFVVPHGNSKGQLGTLNGEFVLQVIVNTTEPV